MSDSMKPPLDELCAVCVERGRSFKARRRCPACRRALCNGHSKPRSMMGNTNADRVCGKCGHHNAPEMFAEIGQA
jgi:hypothetical protein